jgi:hypothetical protein
MTWTKSIFQRSSWVNSWLKRKPHMGVDLVAEKKTTLPECDNIWTTRVAKEVRDGRHLTWQIEVPSPHTQEYRVIRFPASVSISVLRTGSGIESAKPEDLFRRTMPLRESVISDPMVSLEGDLLTVSFRLADRASGTNPSAKNIEYKWLPS